MTVENRTEAPQLPAERQTLSDLVEQLTRFEGPPEQFLLTLLAVQCHISGSSAGAIIRGTPEGKTEVLSIFPQQQPGATAPVWLAQAVEYAPAVLATARPDVKALRAANELYGQPSSQHLIMVPIRGGTNVRGLSAFLVDSSDTNYLRAARERLELTSGWLSLYEMRLTLQRRQSDLRRLRVTMETLVAVNDQDRFAGTAMTFCNEVASRWQADRVGLGLLDGRYVKLKALSHTEKFSRKQKLVQDIESAMEECVDQNVEIVHPAPEKATYVSRATSELCKRHGPAAVVSLPLRRAGEPTAVLTVQRPVDRPFSLEELESLRLACDLCTPRVAVLHEHDRWVGAKLAGGIRKSLAFVVGSKHTWAKLVAILVLAGGLFIILAKGTDRAEAPFALEAAERQTLVGPYEGFLVKAYVKPGERVEEGQILASLKTDDLQAALREANNKYLSFKHEAEDANSKNDFARKRIAEDRAREVGAHIDLLNQQIEQASIKSPIAGTLLSGDWTQHEGMKVTPGQKLFEVAPLDKLWAELSVPEDQIADVQDGYQGELACVGYADRRVAFTVERINPMAEVVNQQNVFKVRVRLAEVKPWMKVGMEGVAKVTLGEDRYVSLWTRRLVNWVRMKLWI